MGLNLHAIVRPVINAVNPDMLGQWHESTGYTISAAHKQAPAYTIHEDVPMNVQGMRARDLRHKDMLNVQGVVRKVYMFGNKQGVVRVDAKGGDLLVFPQERDGPTYTWKVVAVFETWTPTAPGWCCVGVVLQA